MSENTYFKNKRTESTSPSRVCEEDSRKASGERRSDPNKFLNPLYEDNIYLKRENQLKTRVLESTRKSLRLLKETEKVAESTNNDLLTQRQQLIRASKHLNDMQSSLKESGNHINGIKSPFNVFKNFLCKKRDQFLNQNQKKNTHNIMFKEVAVSETDDLKKEKVVAQNNIPMLPLISIADNKSAHLSHTEKEVEDGLNEMIVSVAKLKHMALEMGNELDLQNKVIDDITNKTEGTVIILQNHNKAIKTLLK